MSRLFLFAVGGTGARVLRALTHILGAGAALRDFHGRPIELVPLVIDPDADNGDTLDCLRTLVAYTDLRNRHLGPTYRGAFLATKISRYQELQAASAGTRDQDRPAAGSLEQDSFRCGIVDRERSETFSRVIGYDYLSRKTQLLIESLYSQSNLDTKLSGGFLGNPNLGTIVLNKIKNSDQFRMLPGLFHGEDRIFIISSIFGGTGASGFPVLVKLLRDAKDEQGNEMTVLREASIGALTVLPYFSVTPDAGSPIDSNAFISKTKAALSYYAEHLGGVQALYYIGDKARKVFSNTPTGPAQSNQDHFVEFLGATAVLQFASRPPAARPAGDSFELGISDGDSSYNLASFGDELTDSVGTPLAEFALATRFLEQMTASPSHQTLLVAQPWAKEARFDRAFFTPGKAGSRYGAFQEYTRLWSESMSLMASNNPPFEPFGKSLEDLRIDSVPVTSLDTDAMNMALNALNGRQHGEDGSVQRLLGMLSEAATVLHASAYQIASLKV